MDFEYQLTKYCEVMGNVTLTMLVMASNGGGCQIEAFEKPIDCEKRELCPGGNRCLLKESNMGEFFEPDIY